MQSFVCSDLTEVRRRRRERTRERTRTRTKIEEKGRNKKSTRRRATPSDCCCRVKEVNDEFAFKAERLKRRKMNPLLGGDEKELQDWGVGSYNASFPSLSEDTIRFLQSRNVKQQAISRMELAAKRSM